MAQIWETTIKHMAVHQDPVQAGNFVKGEPYL